jgi:pyruvate,water dikinase
MAPAKLIFWFEELGQEYNDAVGKKGANLGELCKLGMPVAPGFVISIETCRRFFAETSADEQISRYITELGNISDIKQCDEASRVIRSMVEEKEMPGYIAEEIKSYYKALCQKVGVAAVAVSTRSGAPVSRPGMFDTCLNLKGEEQVLQGVKKVWSSAFTTRAIWYRTTHGISIAGDILGVTVQKLVNARTAGITFTADPVTGDTSRIIVHACWGLGEGVVSGKVVADKFILSKETLEVLQTTVNDKITYVVCSDETVETKDVPADKQSIVCISEPELKEVSRLARFLDQHLGQPQDIEWAIDPELPFPDNIFLFQARPVKITGERAQTPIDRLLDTMVRRATRP